jgi:hypothetical protein
MSNNPQQVIVTPNGTFELAFQLFTSGLNSIGNQYLASPTQNIYCTGYTLYSDNELKNCVGESYYTGQVNSILNKNNVIDSGIAVFDLKSELNLGTFSTTYSYVNVEDFNTAAPVELLNNSIVTGGTGDFAFASGDLIITNSFGVELVQVLYYKKVMLMA